MDESKNPGTQNQSRLPVDNLGSFVRGRTFYQQPDKGNAVVGPSSQGDGWSAYILYKDHAPIAFSIIVNDINGSVKGAKQMQESIVSATIDYLRAK